MYSVVSSCLLAFIISSLVFRAAKRECVVGGRGLKTLSIAHMLASFTTSLDAEIKRIWRGEISTNRRQAEIYRGGGGIAVDERFTW